MSDAEYQLILEDIRALDDALSRTDVPRPIREVSLKKEIIPSNDRPPPEVVIYSNNHFPTSESVPVNNEEFSENPIDHTIDSVKALELNQKLIEHLIATRSEVATILDECKRKRGDVDRKIKQRLRMQRSRKGLSSHAGMPYFKDKGFFMAPENEDTKLKKARGELQIINLRRVSRWTLKDKETLLNAIYLEVISKLKDFDEKEVDKVEKMTLKKTHSLPAFILNAIGHLGEREFDWMKIAVTDFQNKHSPEECRVMWNAFLHPDINKFKWKTKELSNLHNLAKDYKYQNWNMIAKDLGTQRSGYQCFVKYNTTKKSEYNEKPWVKSEDKKLIHIVNKFKIGDFINWGDVASCIENRTKQQIYFRWMYSLAPHLKKGRFTDEEDKLLIEAVDKYGTNFKRISTFVLPARTSSQLNNHYHTIVNKDNNIWTIQQDTRLLELYDEHGNNWAKISTLFDGKSRVQLRHRYCSIIRYEKRGIALTEIPRNNFQHKIIKQSLVFHKVPRNINQKQPQQVSEIDKEIIEYFQKPNAVPSKVGRRQKFYHPNELDIITKKTFNILELLHAKLNIPYDLDEYECLTEKDKQLLNSLKNLPHNAAHGSFSRHVEHMRLTMFGHDEQENNFVPPLPSGGFIPLPKGDNIHHTINDSPFNDQKFLEEPEMTFKTPYNIIQPIGGYVNYEFDKLGELLARKNYKLEKQIINSIYVLTPDELARREMGNRKKAVPSTSSVSNSDVMILPTYQNCSMSKDFEVNKFPSMKPDFWTLRGYQKILDVIKDINPENNLIDFPMPKMNERGKKALDMLKVRLIQLFKYPIIMSQVMPPEFFQEAEEIFNQGAKRKNESSETGKSGKRKKNSRG